MNANVAQDETTWWRHAAFTACGAFLACRPILPHVPLAQVHVRSTKLNYTYGFLGARTVHI